jgi:hypothetical protein
MAIRFMLLDAGANRVSLAALAHFACKDLDAADQEVMRWQLLLLAEQIEGK